MKKVNSLSVLIVVGSGKVSSDTCLPFFFFFFFFWTSQLKQNFYYALYRSSRMCELDQLNHFLIVSPSQYWLLDKGELHILWIT